MNAYQTRYTMVTQADICCHSSIAKSEGLLATTRRDKRINELRRDMERVRQGLHGLKADMEPNGHISDIGNLGEDLDSLERKVDKIYERLSHQINQLAGRQEVMLQMLTRIYDLPEE